MSLEKAKALLLSHSNLALQKRNDELQRNCTSVQNDFVRRGMSVSSPAAQSIARIYGDELLASERALIVCLEEICATYASFIFPDATAEIRRIVLDIFNSRHAELDSKLLSDSLYRGGCQFGNMRGEFDSKAALARASLETQSELSIQQYQNLWLKNSKTTGSREIRNEAKFIPANSPFDAFKAVAGIFEEANVDLFVVDPYLDEVVLTDYAHIVKEGVPIRLLGAVVGTKPSLLPAARRWRAQHGESRPIEVRFAPAKALHDRLIIADKAQPWTMTQSLKNLADRSPAELVLNMGTAELKIAAYEEIWARSEVQNID